MSRAKKLFFPLCATVALILSLYNSYWIWDSQEFINKTMPLIAKEAKEMNKNNHELVDAYNELREFSIKVMEQNK